MTAAVSDRRLGFNDRSVDFQRLAGDWNSGAAAGTGITRSRQHMGAVTFAWDTCSGFHVRTSTIHVMCKSRSANNQPVGMDQRSPNSRAFFPDSKSEIADKAI